MGEGGRVGSFSSGRQNDERSRGGPSVIGMKKREKRKNFTFIGRSCLSRPRFTDMLMASSVWIARHDLPVFNKSCCQNKPLTTTQRRRRRERERGTTFIDGGLASHDFDDEHREGGMHPTRSLAGPGATDSTDRGIQRQSGAKRETKFISPVFVTSDRRRWAGGQGRVQRRDGRRTPRSPASGRFISEVFKRRGSSRTRTERLSVLGGGGGRGGGPKVDRLLPGWGRRQRFSLDPRTKHALPFSPPSVLPSVRPSLPHAVCLTLCGLPRAVSDR